MNKQEEIKILKYLADAKENPEKVTKSHTKFMLVSFIVGMSIFTVNAFLFEAGSSILKAAH